MLRVTIELLITLLSGVRIFQNNATFLSYKKFVNAFNDLKNVLLLLVDKTSHLNCNEKIANVLLTAIYTWNETQRALNYYMPKTVTAELKSPILKMDWCQIIKNIPNIGNDNCHNSVVCY